jgi:hypothetical protein
MGNLSLYVCCDLDLQEYYHSTWASTSEGTLCFSFLRGDLSHECRPVTVNQCPISEIPYIDSSLSA